MFLSLGTVRLTAFVFCFSEVEGVAFPSNFHFFELALARSRHRLMGAELVSASNWGSMTESVMDM